MTKDGNETAKVERLVARVTVTADAELLPPVVEFVRQTTHRLGVQDEVAAHYRGCCVTRSPTRPIS